MSETFWRRCSTCKREIGFSTRYWTCSVSTCNRKGSSFVFCAVECWQSHVPTMRHRESWAEEQRSPSLETWAGQRPAPQARRVAPSDAAAGAPDAEPAARRVVVAAAALDAADTPLSSDVPRDILIVASKLKQYVKARSGLNTSDSVMRTLSDRVRRLCDDAITRAREDGRKTLMDRDF